MGIANAAKTFATGRLNNIILNPIATMLDENLSDIVTTIGKFVIRSIRGKFQRSITFTVGGGHYASQWMEDALYAVLYRYNDLKNGSMLELSNHRGTDDETGMYYRLDDGVHNLKYRNYSIMLVIQTVSPASMSGRITNQRIYTIITYDLSPDFVQQFERDMAAHRNAMFKLNPSCPTVNVYQDVHESDGYTYWEKSNKISKRRLSTIYLPNDQKKQIVDTVNEFFANKEYYVKHGVAHNLKIMLYGEPGTGKDSIAKMIASEWNRNIYYVTGGKDGRFVPNAITDNNPVISHPLFLISDMDKYPYLINEPDISTSDESMKEDKVKYKQLFGNMINALDGILSGEDRIIIMTTNHIEKFSKTLLRPGRVDLVMEIGYVTPDVFRKYVHDYYQIDLAKDIKLKSNKLTIASLQYDVMFLKLSSEEFIKKYVK